MKTNSSVFFMFLSIATLSGIANVQCAESTMPSSVSADETSSDASETDETPVMDMTNNNADHKRLKGFSVGVYGKFGYNMDKSSLTKKNGVEQTTPNESSEKFASAGGGLRLGFFHECKNKFTPGVTLDVGFAPAFAPKDPFNPKEAAATAGATAGKPDYYMLRDGGNAIAKMDASINFLAGYMIKSSTFVYFLVGMSKQSYSGKATNLDKELATKEKLANYKEIKSNGLGLNLGIGVSGIMKNKHMLTGEVSFVKGLGNKTETVNLSQPLDVKTADTAGKDTITFSSNGISVKVAYSFLMKRKPHNAAPTA